MLSKYFRYAILQIMIAVAFVTHACSARAGTWSPTPTAPILVPNKITFAGGQEEAGSELAVGDGAVITIAASSSDDDTLSGASSSSTSPDGAQIVWTCSDGTLAASRTDSGMSTTWTAPTLGSSETSREVTLTGMPDDDSTTNPGGPLNGHGGNRNDGPGTGIVLTVLVTKNCQITKITSDDYIPIGDNITLTAHGANLSGVNWSGGGSPATGTGETFVTKWTSSGAKNVNASCGTTNKSKTVKVVEVTGLDIDTTSDTAWAGTNNSVVAVKASGKKVVLKATTNPNEAGAWDLIQWTNGDAVAGAKNKRSVSKAASGKTEVTATCGTSSASKMVVIVWVTFTDFQIVGPKPADSDVQPADWGVPVTKAFNGVLIQATVSPADAANYGVTFNFKRLIEGVMWGRTTAAGWFKLVDKAAGSDDDQLESDEDLSPSAAGHIYVMDETGQQSATPPANATDFVLAASFLEYVEVTVGGNTETGSDFYAWHSSLWCDVNAGAWGRKAGKLNEIAAGEIAIEHTANPDNW